MAHWGHVIRLPAVSYLWLVGVFLREQRSGPQMFSQQFRSCKLSPHRVRALIMALTDEQQQQLIEGLNKVIEALDLSYDTYESTMIQVVGIIYKL